MPYQYSDYCYATVKEAAGSVYAEPTVFDNTVNKAMMIPTSFTVSGSTAVFSYKVNGTGTAVSVTRTFPTCSTVGPIHNNSGLITADVVQASWMVFAVFAAVWAVKQLRNTL